MKALEKTLRTHLERTVKAARMVAEAAAHAAVGQLGVGHDKPEAFLSDAEKALRNRLRTHGKQLGDARDSKSTNPTYGKQEVQRLVQEVAYQHWHRMLFARFLADNNLLMYDGVAVTIEECDELASDEGAKSGWELAGKLAARMLPQIFRPDSAVYELSLPQEHQHKLEMLVANLPQDIFLASDSLGWVYQFWQADSKDQINKSGVKIGADELPAVTQLFTEDYMVDFLLDNTLGAWHVGKVLAANPELAENAQSEDELREAGALPGCSWRYLRFIKSRDSKWTPAAGPFDGWPKSASALRALDPCMGSGHFVVAMFERLVALRIAEEKLDEAAAVAAVIRDNLFGLELDPRCTQIGAFNLALAAWRRAGHCKLPAMNLACSGLAPNTRESDWLAIAGDDQNLQRGMERLYRLFTKAAILGSLINPRADEGDLLVAAFHELQPLLEKALAQETKDDTAHEMAVTAHGLAKAAEILTGEFTLVATNVPYVGFKKQHPALAEYTARYAEDAKHNLATVFMQRCVDFSSPNGTTAVVTQQNFLFLGSYKALRERLLQTTSFQLIASLGVKSFATPMWDFSVCLAVLSKGAPKGNAEIFGIDAASVTTIEEKSKQLCDAVCDSVMQSAQTKNPDCRITFSTSSGERLENYAFAMRGIVAGDLDFWNRNFWEVPISDSHWRFLQTTFKHQSHYTGRTLAINWSTEGKGMLRPGTKNRAYGRTGVAVCRMGEIKASLYSGDLYDQNVATVVPFSSNHLPAIWSYCSSKQYETDLRDIDQKLNITNATLVKVPFDLAYWQKVAAEKYPDGLPKPFSSDPTQWLFNGHPDGADRPLQVAVARLLGYRWPRQTGSSFPDCQALGSDGLEGYADHDGIVCIPPVGLESSASDRLLNLLAAAYGSAWSNDTLGQLLTAADHAGKSLETWLRDKYFTQHCTLFGNRPFVWHIWDGLRDGFAALVNYHKLDYKTLEALIYTYLGDWISRQKRDADNGVDGAQEKLAAAESLKKRLETILAGEEPYDIFVRWKPIEEQPIGWNPDLNDGVRMNIRPFLSVPDVGKRGAGVLRDRPNIKWEKDRGSNVPSAPWYELGLQYGGKVGDRINDHHLSLTDKRSARERAK